jgi:hypothetical protein
MKPRLTTLPPLPPLPPPKRRLMMMPMHRPAHRHRMIQAKKRNRHGINSY